MNAKPALTLRSLAESDRAAWEPHWQGYLTFYKTSVPKETTDITWKSGEKPTEYIPNIGSDSIMGPATFLMVRANTHGQKAIAASTDARKTIESHGTGPVHEFFTDIDEFVKFVNKQ